jgi:hypothetical protein
MQGNLKMQKMSSDVIGVTIEDLLNPDNGLNLKNIDPDG